MKDINEYLIILESLEIPTRHLKSSSRRTPEWEILDEIKRQFNVPERIKTRMRLAKYLEENVTFDELFSFLGFAIQPFARMVVEVFDFLHLHQSTVTSGQSISTIRVGSQIEFPVDLDHMPREHLTTLAEVVGKTWDTGLLLPLVDSLHALQYIAVCDGKHRGRQCRSNDFGKCRHDIESIAADIEAILEAQHKMPPTHGLHYADERAPAALGTFQECSDQLPNELIHEMDRFMTVYNDKPRDLGKPASDCLSGQERDLAATELYTQKEIARVLKILDEAKTERKEHREIIKEFLRLPYWRQRHDLYEIWVLVKTCGVFPSSLVKLCNIDKDKTWNIPGNSQGKISAPVLELSTESGKYKVFTGLLLKGFFFPFERKKSVVGAMPDWLFCREVTDTSDFDFKLLRDESERFEENKVVPEFIVECKAGHSYDLEETIRDPMVERYLPLLRTEKGTAVLVNYREFGSPSHLSSHPCLRDAARRKYSRILAIEQLAPGAKDSETEFIEVIRSVFNLPDEVTSRNIENRCIDMMLVFDTTSSMRAALSSIKGQLTQGMDLLRHDIEDLRVGVIAVGDHCDEASTCEIKSFPLNNNLVKVMEFIHGVSDTDGGDEPEAYEDALRELAGLSWRPAAKRIAYFIGDAYPHPPEDCPLSIDWKEQVGLLKDRDVIVHGIQLSDDSEATKYFTYLCEKTNGEHFQIDPTSDLMKIIRDTLPPADSGLVPDTEAARL